MCLKNKRVEGGISRVKVGVVCVGSRGGGISKEKLEENYKFLGLILSPIHFYYIINMCRITCELSRMKEHIVRWRGRPEIFQVAALPKMVY